MSYHWRCDIIRIKIISRIVKKIEKLDARTNMFAKNREDHWWSKDEKIVKKNEKKVTYVLSCRLNMKVIGWFHLDHYKVPLSLVTVDFLWVLRERGGEVKAIAVRERHVKKLGWNAILGISMWSGKSLSIFCSTGQIDETIHYLSHTICQTT